uniref:Uncharacterized protein n=1 Tax=Chromera velia CCMP2878 TaxID=1169474 RepID=A0A0G4HVA7_9ALVE|eukprot:Cvel_8768.t1-p1 / transcript=Cvel_8768.t1 / gene=Cvel_8768 / organism=Chromera_velia_CCMP2878 / gene_product=hypothetical protein / transcript_product=hypothetical protein / location=Cvel_scaffold490:41453-47967(+) / protein_length=1282 / sequence_SO=supercontig / SO=protein_coding / is_pseudo=false
MKPRSIHHHVSDEANEKGGCCCCSFRKKKPSRQQDDGPRIPPHQPAAVVIPAPRVPQRTSDGTIIPVEHSPESLECAQAHAPGEEDPGSPSGGDVRQVPKPLGSPGTGPQPPPQVDTQSMSQKIRVPIAPGSNAGGSRRNMFASSTSRDVGAETAGPDTFRVAVAPGKGLSKSLIGGGRSNYEDGEGFAPYTPYGDGAQTWGGGSPVHPQRAVPPRGSDGNFSPMESPLGGPQVPPPSRPFSGQQGALTQSAYERDNNSEGSQNTVMHVRPAPAQAHPPAVGISGPAPTTSGLGFGLGPSQFQTDENGDRLGSIPERPGHYRGASKGWGGRSDLTGNDGGGEGGRGTPQLDQSLTVLSVQRNENRHNSGGFVPPTTLPLNEQTKGARHVTGGYIWYADNEAPLNLEEAEQEEIVRDAYGMFYGYDAMGRKIGLLLQKDQADRKRPKTFGQIVDAFQDKWNHLIQRNAREKGPTMWGPDEKRWAGTGVRQKRHGVALKECNKIHGKNHTKHKNEHIARMSEEKERKKNLAEIQQANPENKPRRRPIFMEDNEGAGDLDGGGQGPVGLYGDPLDAGADRALTGWSSFRFINEAASVAAQSEAGSVIGDRSSLPAMGPRPHLEGSPVRPGEETTAFNQTWDEGVFKEWDEELAKRGVMDGTKQQKGEFQAMGKKSLFGNQPGVGVAQEEFHQASPKMMSTETLGISGYSSLTCPAADACEHNRIEQVRKASQSSKHMESLGDVDCPSSGSNVAGSMEEDEQKEKEKGEGEITPSAQQPANAPRFKVHPYDALEREDELEQVLLDMFLKSPDESRGSPDHSRGDGSFPPSAEQSRGAGAFGLNDVFLAPRAGDESRKLHSRLSPAPPTAPLREHPEVSTAGSPSLFPSPRRGAQSPSPPADVDGDQDAVPSPSVSPSQKSPERQQSPERQHPRFVHSRAAVNGQELGASRSSFEQQIKAAIDQEDTVSSVVPLGEPDTMVENQRGSSGNGEGAGEGGEAARVSSFAEVNILHVTGFPDVGPVLVSANAFPEEGRKDDLSVSRESQKEMDKGEKEKASSRLPPKSTLSRWHEAFTVNRSKNPRNANANKGRGSGVFHNCFSQPESTGTSVRSRMEREKIDQHTLMISPPLQTESAPSPSVLPPDAVAFAIPSPVPIEEEGQEGKAVSPSPFSQEAEVQEQAPSPFSSLQQEEDQPETGRGKYTDSEMATVVRYPTPGVTLRSAVSKKSLQLPEADDDGEAMKSVSIVESERVREGNAQGGEEGDQQRDLVEEGSRSGSQRQSPNEST